MTELNNLEADEREAFALSKFMSMVEGKDDGDEKSKDSKFRAAARSWRQISRFPETERFVNCNTTLKKTTHAATPANCLTRDGCTFQCRTASSTPLFSAPRPRS
jgi:hypothetical protein